MSRTQQRKTPLPNVVIVHIIEYACANVKTLAALELTSRFCQSVLLRDPKASQEMQSPENIFIKDSQKIRTLERKASVDEYFSPWQECFKYNFEKRFEWLLKTFPHKTTNRSGRDPTLHIDVKQWKSHYREELRLQDFESQMLVDTSPYAVEHHYLAVRQREMKEYARSGKYYVKPNILVIGDEAVGKSCFVRQFVHGQFYNFGDLLPTDVQHSVLIRDDIKISNTSIDYVWLQLRDAQDCSCILEPVNGKWPRSNHWVRGKGEVLLADTYILIFDITRQETLTYISTCIERIMAWKLLDDYRQLPIVLVANKCDLSYWEMAFDMASIQKELHKKYDGAYPLLEISCKKREDVDKVIRQTIKLHRKVKKRNGFQYSNHQMGAVQKLTTSMTGMIKFF